LIWELEFLDPKPTKTEVVAFVVRDLRSRRFSERRRRAGLPLAGNPGGGFSSFWGILVGIAVLVKRSNRFLRKGR